MLLPILIIEKQFAGGALRYIFLRNRQFPVFIRSIQCCHLQGGKRLACIAIGESCQFFQQSRCDLHLLPAKTPLISQGTVQEGLDIRL